MGAAQEENIGERHSHPTLHHQCVVHESIYQTWHNSYFLLIPVGKGTGYDSNEMIKTAEDNSKSVGVGRNLLPVNYKSTDRLRRTILQQ